MTCTSGISKHTNYGARRATAASWTLPTQTAAQWPTPATSDQPLDG